MIAAFKSGIPSMAASFICSRTPWIAASLAMNAAVVPLIRPASGPQAIAIRVAATATFLSGAGKALNALTALLTASVTAFSAGSNAINRSAPNAPTLPLSAVSLSLYSSAFCAKAVVIFTDSLSMAWPPMLSIGIMSAPALPKRFTASAAFTGPSAMDLNRLAISSVT